MIKNDKLYKHVIHSAAGSLWRSVTHRFWYKLLSVLLAVLIWSYAISSNTSLPRDKWLDVDIRITGQTMFSSRNLALLSDLTQNLTQARVLVSVPQQMYDSVTGQNISVELDLSTVRAKGVQSAKLRASTMLGSVSVLRIQPETIEFEVDAFDQRNIPVNDKTENVPTNYYDKRTTLDPTHITVTGPASIVQRISTAQVAVDFSMMDEMQSLGLVPVYLDSAGEEVDTTLLTKSTSSVTVAYDVYPKATLPIADDIEELYTGELPIGYQLDGIEVQPSVITIAAEQSLLDSMSSVRIRPVDISNATKTFDINTPVNKLSDIKYYSSEYVNVQVDISEQSIDRTFTNCPVTLTGLDDQFRAKWSNPRAKVVVRDLYSIVNRLEKSDLDITVDLSQIREPGVYELPIRLRVDNYPELGYDIEPSVARVTITAR